MDPQRAAESLSAWYTRHARDLPWRRGDPEPYHVLVAEFVLQQTRMETGLPYYERFVQRFPTIHALAAAAESDVLALWSGLGYYRRARNLHAAARRIVEDHAGRVPRDVDALQALPGIGPYTAGAIASVAYDRPEPAIDGNQARVLGRLFGVRQAETAPGRRKLKLHARSLLSHASPRRINQALMDLGSTVCLPKAPRCGECPVALHCRSKGQSAERRARAPRPTEDWEAVLHVRDGRLWLATPADSGLLSGLWLPPLRRTAGALQRPDAVHKFSHRTWRVRFVRARSLPRGSGRWVAREDLARLAHGRLTRLALDAALGPTRA